VGSGYVARRHIRLLQAFGAHVHVADPFLSVETAAELGVEKVSLEQVFGESSVIAVHVPKTPDTHHIIGAELLRRIQPGAILIQTSRSWVLDEQALLAELQTGRFYAAIDVFDQEPQPPDSPFYQLENVLATPHIAGASVESMAHQGYDMALEVQRFARGEPLRFAIAAERYHQMA
jgi:phosphoglycerate dehydrogenase-like enzyme